MNLGRLILALVVAAGLYPASDDSAPPPTSAPNYPTWGTERDRADPYRQCVDTLVASILRQYPTLDRRSAVAIAESACLRRTDINL